MNNLSKAQLQVIEDMKNQDMVLVTNEGKNLKAWLERIDRESAKNRKLGRNVRIATVKVLFRKGVIEPLSDEEAKYFPSRLFPYKLTSKYC